MPTFLREALHTYGTGAARPRRVEEGRGLGEKDVAADGVLVLTGLWPGLQSRTPSLCTFTRRLSA